MQISRALVSPSDKCRFKFLATRELVEGGERREARQIRKKKKNNQGKYRKFSSGGVKTNGSANARHCLMHLCNWQSTTCFRNCRNSISVSLHDQNFRSSVWHSNGMAFQLYSSIVYKGERPTALWIPTPSTPLHFLSLSSCNLLLPACLFYTSWFYWHSHSTVSLNPSVSYMPPPGSKLSLISSHSPDDCWLLLHYPLGEHPTLSPRGVSLADKCPFDPSMRYPWEYHPKVNLLL